MKRIAWWAYNHPFETLTIGWASLLVASVLLLNVLQR